RSCGLHRSRRSLSGGWVRTVSAAEPAPPGSRKGCRMEETMRKTIVTACLLAAGCTQTAPVEPSASEAAQLEARLAGYEQSGPPVSCVNMRDLRGNRSYGEGVIVFDGPSNASLYVNR